MERLTGDIEHLGWRIGVGFAGAGSFYAAYTGAAFRRPERGVLAAMARPEEEGGGAAAQILVHELAEGYFSARPTFGPKRAVARALAGINDWLVAQLRHGEGALAPVSVTALLFHDTRLAVARVGLCKVFRVRGSVVMPLLDDQRAAAQAAVGREAELATEFFEETAEAGDRFVLVSGAPPLAVLAQTGGAEALAQAIVSALAADPLAAAMVLDVQARPAGGGVPELGRLPLRPAPREGDVWDDFRIGRTLYRGRYTLLKAAYDEVNQRDVALKIPLPAMLQDEIFAAGFMREAWIGVNARGANLARYHDVPAERRRSLYLVMPLYQGETLETRLLRAPPVALPEGIGIILKLCEAVQDLAAIEVIHRDIKPDNVMLSPRNEVRLLDLGLAYLPGIDAPEATRPGGTLRYMAPELIKGAPASARSEVFALAVTAYRMFAAGLYPFGQRERLPLARVRPDLPAWAGEVLGRALAEAPERRFDDAGALAAALQHGLITGEDDPALASWRGEARRLRFWQGLAALFAFGFCVLLARALR